MKDKTKQNETRKIARQASNREINPRQAILAVNALFEGMTSSVWNPGNRRFAVSDGEEIVKVPLDGLDYKIMQEMAALGYHIAQQNGSLRPGEVHISAEISSKHHVEKFRAYVAGLLAKYPPEAQSA